MRKLRYVIFIFYFLVALPSMAQVMGGIYIKENSSYRKYIPYPYLREADVMWSKRVWRKIDLREKMNHPLYFPVEEIKDRKSLMQVIIQSLKTGDLTAYGNAAFDDEFQEPMTRDEINTLLLKKDTVYVPDADNPEIMIETVIPRPLYPSTIKSYLVKEDWFFDKQRSVMEVRIIGICPIREKFDENTGEYRGDEALFWIYFPEARPIFAKEEVFNPYNDAERRTMEDIFMKRKFSSYIYKWSNTFDRKIMEYKSNTMDQLLEAEQIKENIFMMEHDVWNY
jgi:gliding motility associated protien GldN